MSLTVVFYLEYKKLLTAACYPHLSQVTVVKRIQCGEIANGILNPVWARNLKEFSPVYVGGIMTFFSAGKGLTTFI